MGKSIDDVANDIASLRQALLDNTLPIKVQYPGDYTAEEEDKKNPKPLDSTVSELKKALIDGHPKIATDAMLPFDFVNRFNEMHKELVKNPVTEYLEAGGFDGIAAGVEKLYEGESLMTALKYWGSNFVGVLAAAVLGVVGIYLAGRFSDIQRTLQQLVNIRDRHLPRDQRRILAFNENGDVRPQNRLDVEARERRVANGGTSLADLPSSPDIARVGPLREQLEKLNAELLTFNNRAPSFFSSFRKLPSERAAKKAGEGIKRVAEALTGVDHTNMAPIAKGIQKIKDAMAGLKPREVEKVAKATGKLNTAMDGFDPKNLPKANKIDGLATKMGELATATGTLRTKFQELRGTVQSLDQELGTPSSA
ncbi:hypothetical protein [Streptomyces sp. NPDC051909]|uniref:hypothetical protein n=1 Tax=Streptomyces sp. NPDC051909 TaxID=3154944 RepID=UPI00342E0D0B